MEEGVEEDGVRRLRRTMRSLFNVIGSNRVWISDTSIDINWNRE